MSIRLKLIIWFSLLGVVPAILIGIYYGYHSERSIEQKVLTTSLNSVAQTATAIDDRLLYIEKSLTTALQNEVILEMMDTLPQMDVVTRTLEERKIAKHFNAVAFNSPYVKSIAIIPKQRSTTVYGEGTGVDSMSEYTRFFADEKFRENSMYQQILDSPNKMFWTVLTTGSERKICLFKSITYFLYARQIGVAAFIIDEDAFRDYALADDSGMSSFLTTPEQIDLQTMQPAEQNTLQKGSQKLLMTEMQDSFVVQTPLTNGWTYGNVISKDYLYSDLRQTRKNIFRIVALIATVFFCMAGAASFALGNRIKKLLHKFRRLEQGDFTADNVLTGHDELADIEKGYNKMLGRLSHTIDQNYIAQIEKKEAELTALQYQINPHFLYNILEVINSMALVHHTPDVAEVAQCMGRLYRYNMTPSREGTTILDDELHLIEDYIYLQNIQFSGRLCVFYDVQDATRRCNVIKFILQPVVENAIAHGFKDKSGTCCIEISAEITPQGDLKIEVADDGVGMSEQTLQKLREGLLRQEHGPRGRSEGIGLKNVHARLCLYYGEDYGLKIQSGAGTGTTVTLLLPADATDGTPLHQEEEAG